MKSYQSLIDVLNQTIEKNKEELFALNCDIADHPEISGEEYETSKKIARLLTEHGFQVELPFAGMDTAFRAIAGSNNHKHKVAILAEYDALPDVGHACGHCLSGSISCLAAIAAKELQDELDTDIHVLGTPMEETCGGKITMVNAGVFQDYDMALMVHMSDHNMVRMRAQALDAMFFEFHGKAAHASANPWDGINALNAAQLMLHGVDMLRQHLKDGTRMHGVIHKGGVVPGIVPDEAEIEMYVRSTDSKYLAETVAKVDNCAAGGALATGCTWDKWRRDPVFESMKSNDTGIVAMEETYGDLGLPLNGDPNEIFGSTDCGNVSWICPAFHPLLQLAPTGIPIHSRDFETYVRTDKANKCLEDGAKIISYQIAKIFSDPEKIQAMKDDFAKA